MQIALHRAMIGERQRWVDTGDGLAERFDERLRGAWRSSRSHDDDERPTRLHLLGGLLVRRRLLALILALLGGATPAFAQTTTLSIPPGSLMPPVVMAPASAVNGAGVTTANLLFSPDNTFNIGNVNGVGKPPGVDVGATLAGGGSGAG